MLDRNGVILALNNTWKAFYKENDLLDHSMNKLGSNYLDACKNDVVRFVCEDADKAYSGILAVLNGEQREFFLEYPCHTGDQHRWFRMTVSPLTGPKYGAVVSHEEITQRKLNERMPNVLKAMFDISMDGFWELDANGNVLNINDAYAKMSGYTIDELSHMNISQLELIEDTEQVIANLAKINRQGYDQFETCHKHKNGHIIDVEIAAAFLQEYGMYFAFCRDISQRKKTEGILSAVFNASSDGIISYNLYNSIVSANPAVETIFSYKPEELIGCNINKLIPLLFKDRNECNCFSSLGKGVSQIMEVEGLQKSGSKIPLELSNAVYKYNNACYFVIIVRDISTRKMREYKDKAHLDELAHITRLGLMGEMASGIAHEVNQPLTAICNYTQAAINHFNAEHYDQDDLLDILYKTQQQSLRAGEIINRMREFVRSNPKKRSTIEINNLIQEASNLCKNGIIQNNIKLTFNFENQLPSINVDHIQIEQVIINLIYNSIDILQYLPKNQPRLLSIQTQLIDDNTIQVRIKDNGPGVAEDDRPKLFTPFFTTKSNGMGMGLSICRSLVEAHDGTLYFNTNIGKGTTFYFQLPINHERHRRL